jgi:hypothetical protein
MAERYELNPDLIHALRALRERGTEASTSEVAVSAQLLPTEAREALEKLTALKLVNSWPTGRSGHLAYALTDQGQAVCHALDSYRGTPPVGTVLPIPSAFPSLSSFAWTAPHSRSYVMVVGTGPA